MNKSLSFKLFLTVTLLLILIVLIMILLNGTALEPYYRYRKEKALKHVYDSTLEAISKEDFQNEQEQIESMFITIDSTKNVEILIFDKSNYVMFKTSNNFLKNGFYIPKSFFNDDVQFYNVNDVFGRLNDENPYLIETFTDSKMRSDFIVLFGRLNDEYNIILRTPLETIRESVETSNRFLIIVSFGCCIIATFVIYYLANKFTKPIKELNEIALNMSNLDFSKKYEVTTKDEVGTLGKSINKLSTSLEKTIKDLREANMDLEKDVEEKSKLNEMRNQFISDVSHELKTPIALIQGYAEGLADGIITDEESKKYYVDVILDEANKMSHLTQDLLDLSKLEYGNNELRLEDFDIAELVKDTLKKNELIIKENSIKIELNCEKEILVNADRDRIEQVLTNFISNAIKNCSNEKIIKASIEEFDDNVKVHIFNTGNLIKEEDIPRLWTRFYRVDSSRNRETGGTGIGLSLVKAIMQLHHCEYGAKNLENGVDFWFELKKV